jgi:NADH dehydrogenase
MGISTHGHLNKLVVVGGGFAGLNAVIAARRVLGERARILLVSRDRWLTIRPRLYEREPDKLRVDLLETLHKINVDLRVDAATRIDLSGNTVAFDNSPPVSFERLVLATGSTMRRPPVPGAALAYSVDDHPEAVRFDNHLASVARHGPSIAVLGAGFTGIELALEMRDRIAFHAGMEAGESARVMLVDRQPIICAELGDEIRVPILEALRSARIDVRLNADVVEMNSREIKYRDGSSTIADAIVICTGLVATELATTPSIARDEQGRILADEFLRVSEFPRVFAQEMRFSVARPPTASLFSPVSMLCKPGRSPGKTQHSICSECR